MNIKADEISLIIKEQISRFKSDLEVGRRVSS